MDTILIEKLEFYGYHGASEEEQAIGHRYAADVELGFDTAPAGRSDALWDTVNYAAVAQRILEIGTSRQFRLLEALAAALVEAILAEFPVESVRLTVRKPHPPLPAIAASVGVTIERRR